jgi:hypothetical protein
MAKPDEQYSEQEAQRRFIGSLKAALNTPPKPLKSMPKRGRAAQSKKNSKNKKSNRGTSQ